MALLTRNRLPIIFGATVARRTLLAARAMSQSVDVQTQLKEAFLRQPRFAVVGASKDQSKWGTKVRV
jgi:hypothetical protein